ncbi:dihydropteroate synthase [Chondromyces crocatus]|uniref:dihydropteroate synthase n=1 Tax=Chondromyces crocatus TaxID=52 RepID=A0A0K1E6U2_CHOCO|nr:dihydropteroate synthase [Chondromyces crocatus]AKT36298.1 dihydropteroate synthase [Chondromyces crocatus]
MGVLNRTPDSFSDGGRFTSDAAASAYIEAMLAEGADIIDIGAESTRPGSEHVSDRDQIARLGSGVRDAVRRGALVSIDTTSAAVAEYALDEGAAVVNTVSLDAAAALGALCSRYDAALVLMHSRGTMGDMKGFSAYADDAYQDVVADVAREWTAAAELAVGAGLPRGELVFDPGFGFAKNARHSLELVARLRELCALGFPVLVGPSRKSFLARAATHEDSGLPEAAPEQRLGATIAACVACAERGAAIVRVHDVAPVRQALALSAAVSRVERGAATHGSKASADALHGSLAIPRRDEGTRR